MRTELGADIVLCGILSCEVGQDVKWVKSLTVSLFIDQYVFLLEDMYEE